MNSIEPIIFKDDSLYLLDQTQLPLVENYIEIKTPSQLYSAIKKLQVRGAPAIGIAAAYGYYIACKNRIDQSDFLTGLKSDKEYIASSRPTAVNLFWALNRMEEKLEQVKGLAKDEILENLRMEALNIQAEEIEACRKIGLYGLDLIKDKTGVLTHCNAGALATSKYGTATAPLYLAQEKGIDFKVFAGETRPLLQGSRLTAYELQRAGIDVSLITDSMAAYIMQEGLVDLVIVGCDRAAKNGDIANKIGTYSLAVLARAHNIPFYVACPLSTFDMKLDQGQEIPIEHREAEELIFTAGKQTAPRDIKVCNPAFDLTPHSLITGLITEKGIVRPPYKINIKKLFKK